MNDRRFRRSIWLRLMRAMALVIAGIVLGVTVGLAGDERIKPPVAVWPAGPIEVVAAFEQPVERGLAKALVGQDIPYVEANETIDPHGSIDRVTGKLRIAAVRLVDDDRTLIFATDPHPRVARYALPVPGRGHGPTRPSKDHATAVHNYSLSGVEVAWSAEGAEDGRPPISGWWPRLDSEFSRKFTRGSRPHDRLFDQLRRSGRLVISTLVRFRRGEVRLRLDCSRPIDEATLGESQGEQIDAAVKSLHSIVMKSTSQGEPLFLTASVRTGETDRTFSLKSSYRIGEEKTDHPLEAAQLLLPWAPVATDAAAQSPVLVPNLAGGDPVQGRGLFIGDRARCSQCHLFRGQGGQIGPDLTDIARKSRAEIYRSIAAPSAEIDPAYATYTIITTTGKVASGIARAEGADAIKVTDSNAHATLIPRNEIDQIRPSATSIMPVGLTATLGETSIRDIIAYLTSPASQPPSR